MRSRPTRAQQQEAVARRLASLTAELEQARAGAVAPAPAAGASGDQVAATGTEDWWGEHTRVAPALRLVPPDPPTPTPAGPRAGPPAGPPARPPAALPALPVPGRHAARRGAAGGWAERVGVPDSLRGRVRLGSAHLSVVAVLVALASLVGAWWVVRGDAEPAPVPVAAPSGGQPLVPLEGGSPTAPAEAGTGSAAGSVTGSAAGSAAGAAAPSGQATTVTVDVAGKVRRPGIAVLPAGSRVVDALEAAGGARPGVDLSTLNLARPLVDGEQVLVGSVPGAAPAPSGGAPPPVSGAPTLVNLNTASAAELEELPQVGPVTAAAIVAWREQHGGFSSVDQLLEVDGIGEVTLGQIAPHATV